MTPEERASHIATAVYPPLAPSLVSLIADAIRAAENGVLEQAAVEADEHMLARCDGLRDQTEAMRLGAASIAGAIRALKHA